MDENRAAAPVHLTAETIRFGIATFFLVLIAHAIAYLTHEYSHSFMAWSMGWMADPLALDYGHLTLNNVLFLGDVGDNVSYDPILASGHGLQAAVIALSGPFLGNGLLYFLLYRLARSRFVATSRLGLSAVYWLSVMCAGNVWSYVPLRAITTHADIALAARGMQVSTWVLFPLLTAISLYVLYHFFCRMFPMCYRAITNNSRKNLTLLIVMTSFFYFSFFAGDGIDGSYGWISQLLSITSRYLLFPLAATYLVSTYGASRNADSVGVRA